VASALGARIGTSAESSTGGSSLALRHRPEHPCCPTLAGANLQRPVAAAILEAEQAPPKLRLVSNE
jgi:hypothetical protein